MGCILEAFFQGFISFCSKRNDLNKVAVLVVTSSSQSVNLVVSTCFSKQDLASHIVGITFKIWCLPSSSGLPSAFACLYLHKTLVYLHLDSVCTALVYAQDKAWKPVLTFTVHGKTTMNNITWQRIKLALCAGRLNEHVKHSVHHNQSHGSRLYIGTIRKWLTWKYNAIILL